MPKTILPTHCPICNEKLSWYGVELKCCNDKCTSGDIKTLDSFLRNCGVENASEKSLENWGITTVEELLAWTPNLSYKSETNFYNELNKIFTKTESELFANMSFDGAGSTNINKILDFYGNGDVHKTTDMIYERDIKEFPTGIGYTTIAKIEDDWFKNLSNLDSITRDVRWKPITKKVEVKVMKGSLVGKTFILTGSFTEKKSILEEKILDAGGTIVNSVNKNTTYLVCAPNSWEKSSKYTTAKSLSINIITEEELLQLIG